MSWSTSELRVRLAPLNRFKPSSKIFYWPFQGGTSFVDLLCFCSVLCLLCFVRVCLYVLCGHLLGKSWPLGSRLWCLLWVCHFPIGILGQVWYLIVSIPDLCNLITSLFKTQWNRPQFVVFFYFRDDKVQGWSGFPDWAQAYDICYVSCFAERGSYMVWDSLGSSLIIFSSFLFFCFLVKNDSLGNFDFIWQHHLDYPSNFEGWPRTIMLSNNSIVL